MERHVIKRGKIFQAGTYSDKNFEMTAQELEALVANFKPVNLDLNHKTTISRLDSRLGKLAKVACDEKGQLFGEVHIPEWLDSVISKDESGNPLPLGVSCTFDPQTKVLKKLAITDNPRVSDAAIFAAFNNAHPDEPIEKSHATMTSSDISVGEGQLFNAEIASRFLTKEDFSLGGLFSPQEIHDRASRSGAVCGLNEDVSDIQRVHNDQVSQGATCQQDNGFSKQSETTSDDEEKRMSKKFDKEKLLETLSTLLAEEETTEMAANTGGNNPAPTATTPTAGAGTTAPTGDVGAGTTGGSGAGTPTPGGDTTGSTPAPSTAGTSTGSTQAGNDTASRGGARDTGFNVEDDPRYQELLAELEAEKQEKVRLQEEAVTNKAKEFANDIIGRNLNIPANRVALMAAFAQAIRDDQANAVEVTFSSDGQVGSRVDALKALFNDLPQHELTEGVLNPATTAVLLSNEQPKSGIVNDIEAVRQRAIALADKLNKGQRG